MSDRVAAVVLAGGMSRRMGRHKPLLSLGKLPVIVHVVQPILSLQVISPVIVVTGYGAADVRKALKGNDVTFAHNPDFADGGMLSSIKVGIQELPGRCEAFFLVLGDQPMMKRSTFERLMSSEAPGQLTTGEWIATPTFNGRRGHPIFVAAQCIEGILLTAPDQTLKTYLSRTSTVQIPVDDAGILTDLDTPKDYERAVRAFETKAGPPT